MEEINEQWKQLFIDRNSFMGYAAENTRRNEKEESTDIVVDIQKVDSQKWGCPWYSPNLPMQYKNLMHNPIQAFSYSKMDRDDLVIFKQCTCHLEANPT